MTLVCFGFGFIMWKLFQREKVLLRRRSPRRAGPPLRGRGILPPSGCAALPRWGRTVPPHPVTSYHPSVGGKFLVLQYNKNRPNGRCLFLLNCIYFLSFCIILTYMYDGRWYCCKNLLKFSLSNGSNASLAKFTSSL